MPKKLRKSIQDYISKIKNPTNQLHHLPYKSLSSSTNWILRGCRHPRTHSIAVNVKGNEAHETSNAATLSDIDRFLFENFGSLYQDEINDENAKKCDRNNTSTEIPGSVFFESPRFLDLPEDFQDSHRFFVERSSSGSLIEEVRTNMSTSEETIRSSNNSTSIDDLKTTKANDEDDDDDAQNEMDLNDFVTLLTYSPNPYHDFKRSMHEMIEVRSHFHGKVDWEFMEEILFCYLNLNDKKSHKFILYAFAELVIALRENSDRVLTESSNARS